MKDISNSNFGLLIAYALPGFVVIWGLSGIWQTVAECGINSCATIPSLVGFMNTTVAAIAAGMAVSAVRFVVIDTIHSLTGLKRPRSNGPAIQKNLAAVSTVVDHHYRYYQFHANMLVAGVVAYGAYLHKTQIFVDAPALLLGVMAVVFWITSRDNLRKYYDNLETIFNTQSERNDVMSNGMRQDHRQIKVDPKDKTKATATDPSKEKENRQAHSKGDEQRYSQ